MLVESGANKDKHIKFILEFQSKVQFDMKVDMFYVPYLETSAV